MTLMSSLTALVGMAVLLFGRHLFWLFVGASGFAVGMHVATRQSGAQPEWVILAAALVLGVIGALAAVFWEVLAIGVGGFLAGAYATWTAFRLFEVVGDQLLWIGVLLGGVAGAVLVLLLMNWMLIVLSSLIGAALVVHASRFTASVAAALFLALLIVGVAFQAYRVSTGATTPRHRRAL